MQTSYKPIDCDFHDLLLAKATLQELCQIQYLNDSGEMLNTQSQIKDVYTQNKEEFMLLANGEIMRLDKVLSINGLVAPHSVF